jgi:hypothetical protein
MIGSNVATKPVGSVVSCRALGQQGTKVPVKSWLLILLLGCGSKKTVECGPGTRLDDGKCILVEVTRSPSLIDAAPPDAAEPRGWKLAIEDDKMRNTSVVSSSLQSTNTVEFSAPYGSAHMLLVLRRGVEGEAHFIGIVPGQFECRSKCTIEVRFDDEKVRTVEVAAGNSSSTLFIEDDKWLSSLRTAQRLTIEATFFQQGKRQFTFDVSGLHWPPPNAPANSAPLMWCIKGGLNACTDDRGRCESLASYNSATCYVEETIWCFDLDRRICRVSKAECEQTRAGHIRGGKKPSSECIGEKQRVP